MASGGAVPAYGVTAESREWADAPELTLLTATTPFSLTLLLSCTGDAVEVDDEESCL